MEPSSTVKPSTEPLDATQYNHQCYICDKIFSANSNLNRHLRKIHKENVQSPYNNVKCALCDSVYSSSSIYNQHLEREHQVRLEIENLTFPDKESFENWKHTVENETTSQYIKSRGEKKSKNVNKTYYSCNRSGYYVSKARTRKALKKQGSRKINGRCPASMNVTVNTDLSCDVRFVKTHVGHDFELKHLDLSDKDRNLIVQKLVSGLTKKDIIKQLRSVIDQPSGVTAANSASPSSSVSLAPGQVSPASSANITSINVTNNTGNIIINNDPNTCIEILPATGNEVIVSSSVVKLENVPSDTNPALNISNPNNLPISAPTNATEAIISHPNSSQLSSRLHLATTKDIHNIINSKHLDSKLIRHNYDLNNFEGWLDEMKEYGETSTILFYKRQSESAPNFPKLREDDFVIVMMKDGQGELLKKYGNKCIIIDSTHNIHCEYLQITLVSVIDEVSRVFYPVATLFSTRTDVEVLEVFFSIIKDKVGLISPEMMIADELNDFYQAWTKVMTRPTHNLLTPWSVFNEWSRKFELIKSREKLRKVKKLLRNLLTEGDTEKFNRSMKLIIEDNRDDPQVVEFMKYFEEKFAMNTDKWSSCLRETHGASNQLLWRLHEKFKAVYKEGKTSKKLCKYIASLMKLNEGHQMAKIQEIEDSNPSKVKALLDRHKKSVETGSLVYEVAVDPVYWLCPSESSSELYYEVTRSNERSHPRCCDLKCPHCATCRHEYKCTCLDYVVNLNMCKHIHKICAMCKVE